MSTGKIYLIPNSLGNPDLTLVLPPEVKRVINQLTHFIVENEKQARRFLKAAGMERPISELTFYPMGKHSDPSLFPSYVKVAEEGESLGVISDAGCPGVADPGAEIVALAHRAGVYVVPLTGPSSILLALMGSGFSGQSFVFHGYLPIDRKDRGRFLKSIEGEARKSGQTQIFMDTPFRNDQVLEDLIKTGHPDTKLCIAVDITLSSEMIRTLPLSEWKKRTPKLHKRPCMFLVGR
ncbi:SAM-dependent methyltransferase [Halocola ammonii]